MKASSEKSSTTTSTTATQASNQPFFAKAGGGGFFAPVSQTAAPAVQMKMAVNQPGDAFEREADRMADRVMRMPTLAGSALHRQTNGTLQRKDDEKLQKAPASEGKLQRDGSGVPAVTGTTQSAIQGQTGGGQPLASDVRGFMEPRFNADFSNVRVHSDAESTSLSNQLSARAFTYQNHIFFSRDQYQPGTSEGKQLLAHELTHTIQQGHAVQRSPQVSTTTTPPPIQRLGIRDALDFFTDRANNIPGFRMFTVVLGVNPINMQAVDRSAANILRALIELIPGGALITQALDNHGVFNRVGDWVEQQIRTLGMTGSVIRSAINRFLDSLSWTDIFNLGGLWDRARRIVSEPVGRLIAFARGLANGIIQIIKDAILRPLAQLASQSRGWDLLCAVLGRNPITGEVVPRTAETLIGGFMHLIGQDEVWQNIQRGNAVARAWAWFQGALSGVLAFVQQIPALFLEALRSLEIADIILVPRALARVAGVFASFAGRFLSWAGEQVLSLLQIIFEVVAPAAVPFIRRAAGAFQTIIRNPIGFVGNLVRAGIQGFRQFAGNFLTHLRASLIGWLTGAMSGANIYIPQAFNLQEILKFVLSVLGLTWQNIRGKLVRVIGETAVAALETGFDIVVTLVREGPAAAWQKIVEAVGNLRDMVIEQAMNFVRNNIVQAAITRLITSLNPAGAFIQAIIATYNTIMFFVERLQQIGRVAMAFIDSIAAIASGAIGAAANRVEQTMAGMLTLVISFLARIVGLGNVAQAVTNIINRVRQPIDRALDWVVEWIVAGARRLGRLVARGTAAVVRVFRREDLGTSLTFSSRDTQHRLWLEVRGESPALMVASTPSAVERFLNGPEVRAAVALTPSLATIVEQAIGIVSTSLVSARRALALLGSDNAPAGQFQAEDASVEAKERELLPLLARIFDALSPEERISALVAVLQRNIAGLIVRLQRLRATFDGDSNPDHKARFATWFPDSIDLTRTSLRETYRLAPLANRQNDVTELVRTADGHEVTIQQLEREYELRGENPANVGSSLNRFRRLMAAAIRSAPYTKHFQGGLNQRREKAIQTGEGQYNMNPLDVWGIEQEVLRQALNGAHRLVDRGQMFFVWATRPNVGWVGSTGNPNSVIRVELTNAGDVHSHPE